MNEAFLDKMFKEVKMIIFKQFLQFARMFRIKRCYPTCKFCGKVYIENSELGKYNTLFSNVYISGSKIGDFTYIQKNTNVINAEVGKFCSIASGVRIGLGSHPIDNVSSHPAFYSVSQPLAKTFAEKDQFNSFKRTYIGHDVWIGENVLIKDGVKINTGAVIGAGAVVTKDVFEYAVMGGCPARIIRFRFEEKIRKELIKTQWWNKPVEWLKKNCDLLQSKEKFVQSVNSEQQGERGK